MNKRELQQKQWKLLKLAQFALPEERITECMTRRRFIPLGDSVEVYVNSKDKTGFYGGVAHCGSVWGCPVCADRISRKRQKEVVAAMDSHYHSGGTCLMLTFTFQHVRGEKLKGNLDRFLLARRKFKSGRWFKDLKKNMGMVGAIDGREVTYGRNGWHPHVHEIWFVRRMTKEEISDFDNMVWRRWQALALEMGLGNLNEHGSLLQFTTSSDYIAKHGAQAGTWGGDRELVRGAEKKGKRSRNVWEILRLTGIGPPRLRRYWLDLFREYYFAFKGKKQLVWTRELKARYGIGEVTDEKILAEIPEGYEKVGALPPEQWKKIERRGAQGEFMNMVIRFGFDDACEIYFRTVSDGVKKMLIRRE